ncbi:MATH and LRR domain-containing protein PFE0570w-like [Vespula maculifrons]|uniref:MATH and LRR domain-containing protein PFE0570w-like n=1 Tax=Vespula maculifrons TaxID=7453 RepID=A0ABD2C4N6_VESMC
MKACIVMPRFIGHYIGISFQTELLVMTLLGLLNSTLEWHPFDWSQQIEKIWNLSLTQQYFFFSTDFEYWIKTILTWIVITRKIAAYVYTFLYMINFYPILTWSRPNLLLPWLILSFFQNLILKSIVITIFIWLWGRERFSSFRMIEFVLVELLSLTNSAYVWYAIACSYIELKKIERIRKIRKALQAKYSIAYNLFSDRSSMELSSKDSAYGLYSERRCMSLPNLNDAFYRSIFNDFNESRTSRSLTTLTTISSFESDDTEEVISQIIHNNNLIPVEKCMKLLGLTDVDIINARARVRKRILESAIINKIQEEYAKKKEIGKNDVRKDSRMRDPSIIDYLMAKTDMPIFRKNDNRVEKFRDMKRKGDAISKRTEASKDQKINEKIEDVSVEVKKELIDEEVELAQTKESITAFVLDRIDENEETKLEFIKKKKKKKACPLTREKVERRPCFPLVGDRQLMECPFKEQIILSNSIYPCLLNKRNKCLNEVYCTSNREIDVLINDNKIPEENIMSLDDIDIRKLPENDATIIDQEEDTKINFSRSQMTNAKDFTHRELENNSILSCPPFYQKYNITNFYDNELLFDEFLDPQLRFNEKFVENTNDIYKDMLFKPSDSKNLFDRGKMMIWNNKNVELLFKIPKQIACYTGVEYKSVNNPKISNKTEFIEGKLQNFDRELITKHRYTSVEPKGEYKSNDPFNIYESIWSNLNVNSNTNSRNRISTQTTESLDDYIYDNKRSNKNNDHNVDANYMDNESSKFVTNINLNRLLDTKNLIKNDESYEDNLEIGPCYCKNWSIFAMSQVADSSECENSSFLEKPSAYLKEIQNESLHRLTNIKNKIVKNSFDSCKHPEYFDQSRRNISLKKKRKRMTSSKERELLEMKALRAYNEITLMEDKREMEKKKQQKTNMLYSFIDNTRSWSAQVMSCSKVKNNYRQIQRRHEIDSYEFNKHQNHFDSYNEIEIHNTTDSFFEYSSKINNEELIKEKENFYFLENESSSSQLPDIQNKDAAIMLNLLNRHGSDWFKQELRRILAIRDSQVYMKHSKSNQDTMKLNLSLRNSQKIIDSLELDRNIGKEDISIPFGLPSSYQYLSTTSDFGSNQNFKTSNLTESIISEKDMPPMSSDLKDFIEYTENKKVIEEEGKEERKMIDTPKESEIEEIEKFKIDMLNVDKDNSSLSLTNSISFSSLTKSENVVEPIDDRNHPPVRRRNMSLHMMDIARNIHWSLRPRGILLTNKNLQGMNFESSDLCGNQQRDIVDDVTASLVHAAFSHKPEIIIRTFPRDSRSINDEQSTSFFENFYNIYRLPSTVDEFVLRSNNEMDIFLGDALTLPNVQEVEDEVNDLEDILQSSCDSMEIDRNFDLCILVMEDEDLSLDSRSTSTDSLPINEVVQYDSEITIALSETKTMDNVDPEINSLGCETFKDTDQLSLEMIIAFFSFLLAFYIEILGSYFFMSDLHNSIYAYRPYELQSDTLKNDFSDEFLSEKSDMVASSNSVNITEFVVEPKNQERTDVIIDEVEEDDQASIKSANLQVSSIRDSFDTMYTKTTVESENAISFEENSSMEDFS